ncbi:MAG: YibE/F family protein [Firmicutes bacterium]|nr:YibE/F family protein [Bacillota bacterium]
MSFRAFLLALAIVLAVGGVGHTLTPLETEEPVVVKGVVRDIKQLESTFGSFGEMENYELTVELTEKPYKGEHVKIKNTITGQPYFDLEVKKGDRVLIMIEWTDVVNGEYQANLTGFARDSALGIITLLFALSLVVVGGIKGLKALVSLTFMGIMVVSVLLPLILRGYNPVLVTVGIASVVAILFLFFIGGFNKKTLSATIGTVGGLIVAGVLAFIFGKLAYLTGLSSSEAQMLQYFETQIDFQGLLFSGIVLGALGAILDVGMSVASAVEQISETDPTISSKVLLKRGMNVGRDVLGSMSNTLILAYVGTSLPLLLLFQTYDTSISHILNLDLIATEIVRAMAGSTGLTLAVPLTAAIATFFHVRKEKVVKKTETDVEI